MYSLTQPLTGDVILCRANDAKSKNLWGQKLFRPHKNPKYTHVLLMCSNTFAIHAAPNAGVNLIGMHELLCASEYAQNWKVFRNLEIENITKNDFMAAHRLISDAAEYFLFQDYNIMFNIPETKFTKNRSRRSFCSQLIARIFERADISLGVLGKNSACVLPVDIQHATETKGIWRDISDIYKKRVDYAAKSQGLLTSLIESEKNSMASYTTSAKIFNATQKLHALLAESEHKFEEAINKLDEINHSIEKILDPNSQLPKVRYQFPIIREDFLKQGSTRSWQARDVYRNFLTKKFGWYIFRKLLRKK